jgi:PA14 domain/Cellulase (glycosyl hydrolase family 5)
MTWFYKKSVLINVITAMLLMASCSHQKKEYEPIKLSDVNPHYAVFRGKPTLLIGSTEHYGAIINLDFDYTRYLDQLQKDGLNLTRAWAGIYCEDPSSFGITNNTLAPGPNKFICPWARSNEPGYFNGGNKFDLSKWDENYFTRLKDFVKQAGDRGIVVDLGLFCFFYEESMWALSPLNPRNNINNLPPINRHEVWTLKNPEYIAIQEAYIKKIVRELKDFDNVYFEIINEPYAGGNDTLNVKQDWQDWVAGKIAEAEAPLKHKHLIQQNISNDSVTIRNPNPNVSIFSFHYALPEAVTLNYGLNKLIGDGETGFDGPYELPYRYEAWDFLMAGGGMFNHLDYSFDSRHEDGTFQMPVTSPGWGGQALRNQFSIMKKFFESLDFVHMKPDNSVIAGTDNNMLKTSAFVKPGSVYTIYTHKIRMDNMENYSLRFSGVLTPKVSEKYTLYTVSDDGVRLWINNKLLIDNWTSHAKTTDSAVIELFAGKKADIKIEFFNGKYGAMLNLLWKSGSLQKQLIPAEAFTDAGLKVEFYTDANLKNYNKTGYCTQVDFNGNVEDLLTSLATRTNSAKSQIETKLTLNLPKGSYKAQWLNPVSGKMTPAESFEHPGGQKVLNTPKFEKDIVLKIMASVTN